MIKISDKAKAFHEAGHFAYIVNCVYNMGNKNKTKLQKKCIETILNDFLGIELSILGNNTVEGSIVFKGLLDVKYFLSSYKIDIIILCLIGNYCEYIFKKQKYINDDTKLTIVTFTYYFGKLKKTKNNFSKIKKIAVRNKGNDYYKATKLIVNRLKKENKKVTLNNVVKYYNKYITELKKIANEKNFKKVWRLTVKYLMAYKIVKGKHFKELLNEIYIIYTNS